MTPADEEELQRLSEMLATIDGTLPGDSPLHEALKKAGLALAFSFLNGQRSNIEQLYSQLDLPLDEE